MRWFEEHVLFLSVLLLWFIGLVASLFFQPPTSTLLGGGREIIFVDRGFVQRKIHIHFLSLNLKTELCKCLVINGFYSRDSCSLLAILSFESACSKSYGNLANMRISAIFNFIKLVYLWSNASWCSKSRSYSPRGRSPRRRSLSPRGRSYSRSPGYRGREELPYANGWSS